MGPVRGVRRAISICVAATAISMAPQAAAAPSRGLYCAADSAVCADVSYFLESVARAFAVHDDMVALFADPAALPEGADSCRLAVTCDWWPAVADALAAVGACEDDPDLASICDLGAHVNDPTPILDRAQADAVIGWLAGVMAYEGPSQEELRSLPQLVVGLVNDPAGVQAVVDFIGRLIEAVLFIAPDVGPSPYVTQLVLPVESNDGTTVIDPDLGIDDELLVAPQRRCNGQIGFGVWLDYVKEGFSNEVLIRAAAGVNEARLAPGSSKRCPVMRADVDASQILYATSNGGSFVASKTINSGLQSRSGTIRSTDRNQPKLIGAGAYYEWTIASTDIDWDLTKFPFTPVIHMFRSPFGHFKMEATTFVTLYGGYQISTLGRSDARIDWTCTRQGSDPETCEGEIF